LHCFVLLLSVRRATLTPPMTLHDPSDEMQVPAVRDLISAFNKMSRRGSPATPRRHANCESPRRRARPDAEKENVPCRAGAVGDEKISARAVSCNVEALEDHSCNFAKICSSDGLKFNEASLAPEPMPEPPQTVEAADGADFSQEDHLAITKVAEANGNHQKKIPAKELARQWTAESEAWTNCLSQISCTTGTSHSESHMEIQIRDEVNRQLEAQTRHLKKKHVEALSSVGNELQAMHRRSEELQREVAVQKAERDRRKCKAVTTGAPVGCCRPLGVSSAPCSPARNHSAAWIEEDLDLEVQSESKLRLLRHSRQEAFQRKRQHGREGDSGGVRQQIQPDLTVRHGPKLRSLHQRGDDITGRPWTVDAVSFQSGIACDRRASRTAPSSRDAPVPRPFARQSTAEVFRKMRSITPGSLRSGHQGTTARELGTATPVGSRGSDASHAHQRKRDFHHQLRHFVQQREFLLQEIYPDGGPVSLTRSRGLLGRSVSSTSCSNWPCGPAPEFVPDEQLESTIADHHMFSMDDAPRTR